MERPIKTEIRTDYAGTYTAFIYADGHTETEPPGRPLSREDMQRERLKDASKAQAKNVLESRRARLGLSGTPQEVVRDNTPAASNRRLISPFARTINTMSEVASTFRTPPQQLQTLSQEAGLGGFVEGERQGERMEFARELTRETGVK